MTKEKTCHHAATAVVALSLFAAISVVDKTSELEGGTLVTSARGKAAAAVDDGTSTEGKTAALLPATSPGYGTNDWEYLKTWLCNGWSFDDIEMGVWLDCRIVLETGVSDGEPSTR